MMFFKFCARSFIISTVFVITALFGLVFIALPTNAQTNNLVTGVVVVVMTASNGDLTGFILDDGSENRYTFSVIGATEFGLEDQSGERWVATLAEAPRQAALRLTDHRERFAPVTVTPSTNDATIAVQVVEARTANLGTNLGYIFAAFLIGWIAFFAYVIWVAIKQRALQNQLKVIKKNATIDNEKERQTANESE